MDEPQVFIPFATDAKGQTLYETMVEGKCVLGVGQRSMKHEDPAWGAYRASYRTSQSCPRFSKKAPAGSCETSVFPQMRDTK